MTAFSPIQLEYRFTVCCVKGPALHKASRWPLQSTDWTRAWVHHILVFTRSVCLAVRRVTIKLKSLNEPSFQSWSSVPCMIHGIPGWYELHQAVGQRDKDDGCHEGSQHWFLQAKPLACVIPGHLRLLVCFPSFRCPFQTVHHHLENKQICWEASRTGFVSG